MKTIHKVFLPDFYRQLVRGLLSDDLACSFSFRIVPVLFVAFVRYLIYNSEGTENGVVRNGLFVLFRFFILTLRSSAE